MNYGRLEAQNNSHACPCDIATSMNVFSRQTWGLDFQDPLRRCVLRELPSSIACAGQDLKRAEQKMKEKDEEEARAATAQAQADALEEQVALAAQEAPNKKKGWLWNK